MPDSVLSDQTLPDTDNGGPAGKPVSRTDSPLSTIAAGRPRLWVLLVFYAAYIVAARLGQGFAIVPGVSVTFWPPSGVFVAALLLTRRGSWPWWVVTACLAELTCNWLWFHSPVPIALVYFGGNALEALAAAWLIGRAATSPFRLDTPDQVVRLIVFGAIVAPVIGATVIALTDHVLGKHHFLTAWPLVWLGDGTGLLVSTPLTLVAVQIWQARSRLMTSRTAEAVMLAIVLCGLAALCFQRILPTIYLTMLPLLWIAVRFQLRGAAVALGVLVLMTAWFAGGEAAALASRPQLMQQKIELQAFIGISALSALFVAALAQQNQQSLKSLQLANAQLEERVAARTAELSEREQQFRRALDAGGALVYTVGLEPGSVARVHGLERVTGYDPAKVPLTNDWFWSLIHPDDFEAYQHYSEGFIASGGGRRFAYRIRHAGGSWLHIEQTAELVRDGDGKPVYIVGAIVDISERKEYELALIEAQRFSQGLIDAAPNVLYIHDFAEHRNVFVTPQVEAILGYTVAEFQGARSSVLDDYLHPEDRPRLAAFIDTLVATQDSAPHRLEYRMRHKNGRWIWLADYMTVYRRDAQGRPTQLLGAVYDIMELKHQEQLRQLLMREVAHRSKNILSLVQAIARQTARHDPENFLDNFYDRLSSLAAAHDLLVNSSWKGVVLQDLVVSQLGHFKDMLGKRITIAGPALAVNSAAAQSLAMVLHELATNAGKYGALSNANGTIRIDWSLTPAATGETQFDIAWIERGGPKVKASGHRGFGSTVIERMSKAALSADVSYELSPPGVTWRLSCNASQVLEPPLPQQGSGGNGGQEAGPRPSPG